MNFTNASTIWIRDLARPYFQGYRPRPSSAGSLRGFWFDAPQSNSCAGFFAGYLVSAEEHTQLRVQPPECIVFAFVEPGSALHKKSVRNEGSLVRKTFEYIRWLTHCPPRFQFLDDSLIALVRHQPLTEWPSDRIEHFSRNFFIESFAWLVRSGLVRKLAEASTAQARKQPKAASKARAAKPHVRVSRR